jgi:hypothetical protein
LNAPLRPDEHLGPVFGAFAVGRNTDNVMFLLSLPFRNIATMSGGIIDKNQLEGLLTMINGRFFKGLKQIIRKKK